MEKVAEIFGIPILIDESLPHDSISMITSLNNGVHCVTFRAGVIKECQFSYQVLMGVIAKHNVEGKPYETNI